MQRSNGTCNNKEQSDSKATAQTQRQRCNGTCQHRKATQHRGRGATAHAQKIRPPASKTAEAKAN